MDIEYDEARGNAPVLVKTEEFYRSTRRVFPYQDPAVGAGQVGHQSCSDCTAVVSTIAARLSSEESIAAQQVVMDDK